MTRVVALVCAVVAIAAGGYMALRPSTSAVEPLALVVGAANADEAAATDETAEVDTSSIIEMTQGVEDAPVTVIEYASFTCPHCADFHDGPYKQLKADYIDTGKVRFIYREVYFDRYGLWASMIARCAGPEKFFGITDLIYDGQAEWARAGGPTEIVDALRKIGRLAGIDNDKLEACLQDADKAQTLVAWYQKNAAADEVEATPSFIINGKKVENQPYKDLAAIIDAELAK